MDDVVNGAHSFDLMIVGSGPAGLTAALYGQRLGMKCVVFGDIPGGNLYMVQNLSNFPGFPEGISGMEWGVKTFQQAQAEGGLFTMSRLDALEKTKGSFFGRDTNGIRYSAPAVILATGRVPVKLPELDPSMKGVNFCSVCDGPLFRDKKATLAVVGSGNEAAQHALNLSGIAQKVILICGSRDLKMDAAHKNRIDAQENIELMVETEVKGSEGLHMVEALHVQSVNGEPRRLKVDGVFIAAGWIPCTEVIGMSVETVDGGYVRTDENLMTSVFGMFAAGDVRDTDLYQVLSACADGARCALNANGFIHKTAR